MIHDDTHDPLLDYRRCLVCHQAVSAAFTKMADLELGPKDVDTMISKLRELAAEPLFPDLEWS